MTVTALSGEGPKARRTGAPRPGACSAAAEWGPPALRLDFCPLTLWLFLPSLQISMLCLGYKPVHSLQAVQSAPPHSSLQATWLCTHMHTDTHACPAHQVTEEDGHCSAHLMVAPSQCRGTEEQAEKPDAFQCILS